MDNVHVDHLPIVQVQAISQENLQPLAFGGRNLRLVFQDEFSEGASPQVQWSRTFFWGGRTLPSNKEEQIYTDLVFLKQNGLDRPDSAQIRDGVLHLIADRVSSDQSVQLGGQYASGLVTTFQSFNFRYGVVEVRAQAPKGKGFWSALWLLRRDKGSRGEIDIMEVLGDKPDFLNVTLHMGEDGATNINRFVRKKTVDLTADFHVYTLLWSENEIAMALDGVEQARTKTPDALKSDMYFLMNLAVGGKWPGSPNASTPFPNAFKIDYVRIWQAPVEKRP